MRVRGPLAGYRVLQVVDEFFDVAVLLARDLPQWSPVGRRHGLDAEGVVEQWRGDVVRVRDVWDGHPRPYRNVAVRAPVGRALDCAHAEQPRDDERQEEQPQHDPLLPAKSLQVLTVAAPQAKSVAARRLPMLKTRAARLRLQRARLFRHEREPEARARPIALALDFRDEREVPRPARADGVAGRVARVVAVEAEFERLGLAPFVMEERADEVEDGGRADGRAVALRHEAARAPIFVDDAHEFAEREKVVRVARAVDHRGATEIDGEGVSRRVVAVGRAVELPVVRQVTRLLRRLDADDAPLMELVSFREQVAVARLVLARSHEVARRVRVHL